MARKISDVACSQDDDDDVNILHTMRNRFLHFLLLVLIELEENLLIVVRKFRRKDNCLVLISISNNRKDKRKEKTHL